MCLYSITTQKFKTLLYRKKYCVVKEFIISLKTRGKNDLIFSELKIIQGPYVIEMHKTKTV